MITLRPILDEDIRLIKSWPQYPPEFSDLDYSLRDGGWLDEYWKKPQTAILVAMDQGEVIGFSVLSRDSPGKKEFRIALHPHRIGAGKGKTILCRTLEYCFADMTVTSVRLIVRKNNLRAQKLYTSVKFQPTGECTEEIQGKTIPFFMMEIDRRTFFLENRS
ncbi:MAG: GNAT family N-acetyltransferase [Methanoregula sp.]|jgi:RimJ/RimL family protein N-acetyltransferase|nr:GNAT family N-acetyltransferase [Methanoregula sp.]